MTGQEKILTGLSLGVAVPVVVIVAPSPVNAGLALLAIGASCLRYLLTRRIRCSRCGHVVKMDIRTYAARIVGKHRCLFCREPMDSTKIGRI